MRIQDLARKHFQFKLLHTDKYCQARAGEICTPHGKIPTPVFMPVGTHGAVKALQPLFLEKMDVPILLSNTYHLHLSPGSELVKKAGGLHKFMHWHRALLTDSGGFQVFSLKDKKIAEEGVEFSDPQGKKMVLDPEKAIEIQQNLGSDIMMAFDECIPYPASEDYTKKSIERTHRWLDRCIAAWTNPQQALFGIIQGSVYPHYRKQCLREVEERDLPGLAIGGVSVGEGPQLMQEIVSDVAPQMPAHKTRYVMGVGNPEDLVGIWEQGVDMSDCIIPTKFARGGTIFTFRGKIRIRHQRYRRDFYPLDPNIDCYANRHFTRAYVKHLFDSNEILGQVLATEHNIAFYKTLAARAREAILQDRFLDFKNQFLTEYGKS